MLDLFLRGCCELILYFCSVVYGMRCTVCIILYVYDWWMFIVCVVVLKCHPCTLIGL